MFKSTIRYILLILILVAMNVGLDIILTVQSGNSMKSLISSRMLDITNTAADMIDGDALKRVTPADAGTPEYDEIMKTLTYFQDNIELEYIYCIQDAGNKNFVLGLDPTVEDPGEFGSPITYTDALYEASKGIPSVDTSSYEDAWGTFYSAYTPVFASDGTVAGIIAVDFSKDWYDAQMSEHGRTIIIITIVSLAICTGLVFFMASGERQRRLMAEQLRATADIYISLHEANLVNDTFTEIYNSKSDSKAFYGNSRTNAHDLIKMLYSNYTDPSSKDSMLEFVDTYTLNVRLRNVNTVTHEFLNIEGKWRRARFIVSERTSAGEVMRVMYLVEDIDEEKKARDMALEIAKAMNEQISSVANIYFSMHDIDLVNNTLREVKTHVTNITSFFTEPIPNAQQIVMKEVEKSAHKMSLDALRAFVDFSTLEDRFGESNTITEEFLNNNNVWCRARLVISKCSAEGKIEHVLWLIESIDEEKRRRDAISEQAQSLNYQISSISNIYIVVYDVDLLDNAFSVIKSEISMVNDLIGQNRDNSQQTINMVMRALTDESSLDEVMRFIDLKTLESRLENTKTVTLEILSKTKKWIRIRFLESRRTNRGKLSHVLWLAEDIDDEKRERDKLLDMSERAIAASEAKSSFLSNMSHEIRTPINAVLGMNEMILRECEDKNVLVYSNSIRTAGSTLLGLVNDILDFSKIEAGKMEIIPVDYDLSSVINDLVNMVQTKADDKGLLLELDINGHVPKILHGDEVRIKQIITNLLTNAVKYTEKGSVTLCLDYSEIPEEPDFVTLNVAVIDTGIGIKKEDMKKLFSEFDRIEEERNRKIEGTGLGMSIAKRLLEMMDSELIVESIYGMGSKFSFDLRQQVIKWEEIGNYEEAYRDSLGKREKYHEKLHAPTAEILVVDDTPMNLVVFRSLLKQTGVKIDAANSGDEGLELSYDKKYDMIFLDHMMPEKNGIETLHELRSRPDDPNLKTPTVCLTANAISGAREQYLAEGFDDYLTKPIDPEKLEAMLLEYLPPDKIENA